MRRSLTASLTYFWRSHLAVALGAAVATAVLSGALVVGDSVRGSLRGLALDRLGRIDQAVVARRLVGTGLAAELADELELQGRSGAAVAPVLLLPAAAVHPGSGARASGVTLLGVDGGFADLYPGNEDLFDFQRRPGQLFPPVILNQALARELGVREGDEVLLSFDRPSDVPRETLVGRVGPAESLERLRRTVVRVIPDRGPGGFTLTAHQTRSLDAFVPLERLQRTLEAPAEANALLVSEGEGAEPVSLEAALRRRVGASELGFHLRRGEGELVVESRALVLGEAEARAVTAAAAELAAAARPVLTYLANEIRVGERSIPYSTITALGTGEVSGAGGLRLVDGSPAPPLAPGEILLDEWAGAELGEPEPGDEVAVTYYLLGPRDELSTAETTFRLRGVVALAGPAADPTLAPELPGLSDAGDMAAWEPPFPVNLDRIRPQDEDYWDRHRAAPKAFVALAAGQRLWGSRFGDLTSVRLAPPSEMSLEALEEKLRRQLIGRLDPREAGFSLLPLKADALRAARGSTDFAGLFLGFSLFLILSAALLVGLLFRLGVEQRAAEVGLLLAVGYPRARVRRRFLAEGGLLAVVGATAGSAGAVGYAALMLAGLRSWWLPAVGAPVLFLHLEPLSLILGGLLSVALVLAVVAWALRGLSRLPAPALLAGAVAAGTGRRGSKGARRLATASALAALGLAAGAYLAGEASSPALAFGTGAALLVAGLAAFAAWCRSAGGRRANGLTAGGSGRAALALMAARSSARSPGRSLLAVALVASATFLIVVVAANRGEGEVAVTDPASGTGGFTLVAESDVPLRRDLNRPEVRSELGFPPQASRLLAGVEILPFRLRPGEDASCLNLYRPEKPRVLGAPPEMIRRGGFRFQQLLEERANPWTLLTEELEPGVIPAFADANSALWILKVGLGEDLVLTGEGGEEVRLRLVGLFARSLLQSEVVIAEERFLELFPGRAGASFFLIDAPPEEAEAVADLLEAELAPFGFDVQGTARRLAAFRAVESTYLSTFQALGGLGLLLGTLGLGVVLLRNVLERRGELAALRAFGFRRRRLAALVVAENAFLLAVGLAVGTVAALVAVAPHLAESAARLPWVSLAATLLLVFAAGLAASLAAVRGALATPLIPALKTE